MKVIQILQTVSLKKRKKEEQGEDPTPNASNSGRCTQILDAKYWLAATHNIGDVIQLS